MKSSHLILELVEGKTGLWYCTSPTISGLLVAEKTFRECLKKVPEAIEDLEKADELSWV